MDQCNRVAVHKAWNLIEIPGIILILYSQTRIHDAYNEQAKTMYIRCTRNNTDQPSFNGVYCVAVNIELGLVPPLSKKST